MSVTARPMGPAKEYGGRILVGPPPIGPEDPLPRPRSGSRCMAWLNRTRQRWLVPVVGGESSSSWRGRRRQTPRTPGGAREGAEAQEAEGGVDGHGGRHGDDGCGGVLVGAGVRLGAPKTFWPSGCTRGASHGAAASP